MDFIICKYYFTNNDDLISEIYFDIFKNYDELKTCILIKYYLLCKKNNIIYNKSNIKIYRCGTINSFGEFNILSNPLQIYLNEENFKND